MHNKPTLKQLSSLTDDEQWEQVKALFQDRDKLEAAVADIYRAAAEERELKIRYGIQAALLVITSIVGIALVGLAIVLTIYVIGLLLLPIF